MDVPMASHPNWKKIIGEQSDVQFDFLATKILLGRLHLKYKQEPSSISSCIEELREFFVKNENQPKVVADLNKIFNNK